MIRTVRTWLKFQSAGHAFIFPGKLMRALFAAFPAWLLQLWLVLRFVPTPFEIDEWLPLIVMLVILAVQPRRIAWYRTAWRGGKSHRGIVFEQVGPVDYVYVTCTGVTASPWTVTA